DLPPLLHVLGFVEDSADPPPQRPPQAVGSEAAQRDRSQHLALIGKRLRKAFPSAGHGEEERKRRAEGTAGGHHGKPTIVSDPSDGNVNFGIAPFEIGSLIRSRSPLLPGRKRGNPQWVTV